MQSTELTEPIGPTEPPGPPVPAWPTVPRGPTDIVMITGLAAWFDTDHHKRFKREHRDRRYRAQTTEVDLGKLTLAFSSPPRNVSTHSYCLTSNRPSLTNDHYVRERLGTPLAATQILIFTLIPTRVSANATWNWDSTGGAK